MRRKREGNAADEMDESSISRWAPDTCISLYVQRHVPRARNPNPSARWEDFIRLCAQQSFGPCLTLAKRSQLARLSTPSEIN